MKTNNDSKTKSNHPANASAKKNSSALAAASKGERATDHVKPKSTRDVNGSSGLTNTGTNVSYEDKE
jgi:hypothetical protein